MIEVIPAILEKDFKEIKHKLGVLKGRVKTVQLDIEDGIFVPNHTWPFFAKASKGVALLENNLDENFRKIINEEEGMPHWQEFDFEIDLMVSDAVENFDLYSKLGAKRIIFHIEAVGNLENFKDFLEGIDMYIRDSIEIGVAINPSTPLPQIFPLISFIDFVQCMGNDKIGYHGVELEEKVYEKIKILREHYPDLPIAVDIGVDETTAPLLVKAGASKLVAGSAIFSGGDIIGNVKKFQEL